MGERDLEKKHYSEKGGHEIRSIFWKEVRGLADIIGRTMKYNPRTTEFGLAPALPIDQARQIRRHMRRITQDGRR